MAGTCAADAALRNEKDGKYGSKGSSINREVIISSLLK
jgi:hypothetical protein